MRVVDFGPLSGFRERVRVRVGRARSALKEGSHSALHYPFSRKREKG